MSERMSASPPEARPTRAGRRSPLATLIHPKSRRPENSVGFRVAVLGAAMTAIVAITLADVIKWPIVLVPILWLSGAFWFSWAHRAKNSTVLTLALTTAAAIGFVDLLRHIGSVDSPEAARYPLARLFLLVQLIHSYDLVSRRDLYFSLGSSLMLMVVAGSISQDLGFGLTLGVYGAFAVTALVLAHRSELADDTVAMLSPRRATGSRIPRDVARGALAATLAGALLFLVLPQSRGVRPFSLPFSAGAGAGSPSLAGISNPGFTSVAGARSSGSSYYGFSERMDLRVRGSLSDDVVMRVRASAPAMWRSMLFDNYDGTAWDSTAGDPSPLAGGGPYINPDALAGVGRSTIISQTFYVESEQPSTYFAAATPGQIWSTSPPSIDDLGALRATSTLTPGTVYSVVSLKGTAPPSALRRVSNTIVPAEIQRYLQLPPELPGRVRDLAERITASSRNDYDRVRAIEAYLRENYRYSLDSPIPPTGQDAVDHFLFDARVGFCEQFASATAVMLRSLGIPTRVAVGYTPGTRNPLTGYYEVKGSDAHAWVEVYFPGYGWYEFDPTFNVPRAEQGVADNIALVRLWRFLSAHVDDIMPEAPVAAAVLAVPIGALWLWRRRARVRRHETSTLTQPVTTPGPVAQAWERLEADLDRRGMPRREHETAAELMARIPAGRSREARFSLGVFEKERYGYTEVSPADARAAEDAIEDVRNKLDGERAT